MEFKQCKYGCGKNITFLAKTGQPNSTGYYELDEKNKLTHVEHTYAVCKAIIEEQKAEQEKIEQMKQRHGGGLDSFGNT